MLTLGVWLIVLILAVAHWSKIREFIRAFATRTWKAITLSWQIGKALVGLAIIVGLVCGGFYAALQPWREVAQEAKIYGTGAVIGGAIVVAVMVVLFLAFTKGRKSLNGMGDEAA